MKIVQINSTCGVGSTGKICVEISRLLTERNVENYILYSCLGSGYPLGISCADRRYTKLQALKSRIFGNYGFNSGAATRRMIAQLDSIRPDIVHLHNIHGHDCDLQSLFEYLKENRIKVLWTFHDCWAFTGYCTHFVMAQCDKWQDRCGHCTLKSDYSWFFDRSGEMQDRKRELFSGLDLTIITPSQWLADLVGQSFLKEYPIYVINNGIDLNVFRRRESDFRKEYGLERKKIVLGVAMGWGIGKGLDVFAELSRRLPQDYRIVLIGTDENVDKQLPESVLSIHRTQDQQELAQIYSAADVFVNPTREDSYPTVNMEAIACGTPVVTFRTGGSPEMLDESCGSVVACGNVDALEKEILRICTQKPYSTEDCLKKAKAFDKSDRFKEYAELYERIITVGNQGD